MTTIDTTVTAAATPVVKTPSKKSLAVAIFAACMADRVAGVYTTNKAFRAAVLGKIEADLGVSVASAATMYNACKKEAETADAAVGLGRDPKVVKVKVEGAKRGRPAKAKVEGDATPAVAATEPTVIVITEPVAEVAAEVAPEAATA